MLYGPVPLGILNAQPRQPYSISFKQVELLLVKINGKKFNLRIEILILRGVVLQVRVFR